MDSSRGRDRSIERLLRQSRAAPQEGGITDSCLDAETLAAMIDGGLSGPALNAARSHVADCARCQSLVGRLAQVDSVAPAAEHKHAVRWWLAWAVPLTAAAAAVALWVAVPNRHGAPLPQATEAQRQAAEPSAQQPAARADRPEAPASGKTAERPQPTIVPGDAAKKEQDLTSELRRDAGPSTSDSLGTQSASSNAIASSASEAPAPATPAAAAAPPPPSANRLDSVGSVAGRAEAAGIEIISPDPMVRWRIAGSTVQRSTDGGAAWEAQSTGNVADLTAGAASSASVCWVVGRGGVVLLSVDGRSWRRVPFPATTDLSAVRARDARSASVSTADGRTFSTTDAGATWVPRPLQDF